MNITPKIKYKYSPINDEGVNGLNKNSHISIPIPVTIDVSKAINSGRFRSAKALPRIIVSPTTTSQDPIERPNVRYNPTSTASNGDAPNADSIVRAIPNVKTISPAK